ncbi:MAG: class F sortase [Dermatophilaceae bacterium]
MNNNSQHAGRRRSIIAVATSVVLAVVGALVIFMAMQAPSSPPQPPADASGSALSGQTATAPAGGPTADSSKRPAGSQPSSTSSTSPKGADLGPILAASQPVGINIPSIGVRTNNFVGLGLASGGSLEVPKDFSSVGWYTAGPAPGQLGPAILAGHVDDHNGPAIFYRLGALRAGAMVNVARKDGSTAKFTVDRIERFPKDKFPTALVYGTSNRAELRLITCGGSFDPKSGHYVDNIVAFAHLVE